MLLVLLTQAITCVAALPSGAAPDALHAPHFPDALHAFVWRNWPLVPAERMGAVVGASAEEIEAVGRAMGLGEQPPITDRQRRRSYITVIRRNWHLLPYDQLLALLGWSAEEMAYALREDDFLYVKLGNLKPECAPLRYTAPDAAARAREAEIAVTVRDSLPPDGAAGDPLFAFVDRLAAPFEGAPAAPGSNRFSPRYCYSYFALYGDPLLEPDLDPYPDGYLARLAASGVNGVWLQAVLYKLAPFPWEPEQSARWEERLENLRALVERARRHGIGIYLYLNEPRSMPLAFYENRAELRGVTEGDYAALCSSAPEVRAWVRGSVSTICQRVPDLAGFFTISASENLSNCWSHYRGADCPRCAEAGAATVIARLHGDILGGIEEAGAATRLIAWDWGWQDGWVEPLVAALPPALSVQSVSEWELPIRRGGIDSKVGEYSISAIGPGPRAQRNWAAARAHGLRTLAKIQAGNTWELSAVPYIPAVENVARHIGNLREADIDGLMLGWTLGGYPSPNLEVVARMGANAAPTVDEALAATAQRRYGVDLAPVAVEAWQTMSRAFSAFPYNGGTVYQAPLQMGPANLLWERPTGFQATMVGIPYDDLDSWRSIYPAEVFAAQLETVADGFDAGAALLKDALAGSAGKAAHREALAGEARVAEAAGIHFRSVAAQTRFVAARNALPATDDREGCVETIESMLRLELDLALRLHALQSADSRLGFESTNQYFYVPIDLAEKVINCRDLIDRWLPTLKSASTGGR